MNQSLVTALRKHVETDQLSWPSWLDWVLFAYRTRVHTATGFTPFELTFGRKANNFENWRTEPDKSRELELEVRSNEIRKLFEEKRLAATANISKSQEAQKVIQDNRSNVLIEPLKVGTKVMIKNDDRLVKKLEARYRGPYTIVSVTKDNNYVLRDVLGEQLQNSVPLHKLKVTTVEEGEKFYKIKKIITHKLVNGKPLYLVQWEDDGPTKFKDSWVKPKDFTSMKFVNDYHNKLKPKENQRNTRSRTKKVNFLLTLVICFFLVPLAFAQNKLTIKDAVDFDFCELRDDMVLIDLTDLCNKKVDVKDTSYLRSWLMKYYGSKYFVSKSNTSNNTDEIEIFHFQAGILTKSLNMISGKAYQCKKVSITRTWSVGFWGKNYRNDNSVTEVLDADSCWYMVRNKKCDKSVMTCDEANNCRYEEFPPDDYSWLRDSTKTFAHCYVSPKMIAESDLESHIFTGFCKVSDWFCVLHDSIVVWGKEVVHSCPFRKISDGYFDASGLLITERNQKLGFQFKRFENHCGLEFILSTEGLYLAPLVKDLPVLEKFESFVDTRGLMDLALADEDYKSFEILDEERKILLKECKLFVSLLNVFSLSDDKFLRTHDFKNNEVILYTSVGQVFHPRCTKVDEISLITNASCYEDIPVSFVMGQGKIVETGFVNKERIVKAHSKNIRCSHLPRYIKLLYLKKTMPF